MRTIVDLPPEQIEALAAVCRRERISRTEAVRRAVAAYVRDAARDADDDAFGVWAARDVDALRYEQDLREEWEPPCAPSSTPTSSSTT